MGSGSSAKILRFSYDASGNGNVVAVDYSTDNGSTFNTYYLRNAQSDIAEVIVIISVIVHGNDFAVSVVAEAEL